MFGIAVAPRFGITYYSLGVGLHRGGGSDLPDSFLFRHVPVLEEKENTEIAREKERKKQVHTKLHPREGCR